MRNIGKSKVKEIIVHHIQSNIKQYAIITLIFIIGVIFGVIFVNNANLVQRQEISAYIKGFIDNIKNNAHIDRSNLLINSLLSNFLLAVSLWFVGSTVVGIPIVYGTIAFRGFCLGYTISSIVATFGIRIWNIVYNYYNNATKYFVYTMYISTRS